MITDSLTISNSFRLPVLIVEDEKDYLDILVEICDSLGIPNRSAASGWEAMEILNSPANQFSVYIVDLNLPGMNGEDLIKKIKEIDEQAVIIVQTGNITSDTIIQVMKLGIYEYILKPIEFQLFQQTITKALKYRYLLNQERLNREKADTVIRDQIEWLNYKDSIDLKNAMLQKSLTIEHLITSLTQGGGLGSSVAILELVHSNAKKNGIGYTIPETIYDLVIENANQAKLQIKSMSYYMKILRTNPEFRDISSKDIMNMLNELKIEFVPLLFLNKNYISIAENNKDYPLRVDLSLLKDTAEELLINAMKYSPNGSNIQILTAVKDGFFWISFKNSVQETPYTGIPDELKKYILEPFVRIVKYVDENFSNFEKFGIGLGLSAIENIVKKHSGIFAIHEITDYTNHERKSSVLAEILLPITK